MTKADISNRPARRCSSHLNARCKVAFSAPRPSNSLNDGHNIGNKVDYAVERRTCSLDIVAGGWTTPRDFIQAMP